MDYRESLLVSQTRGVSGHGAGLVNDAGHTANGSGWSLLV